ncbi:MAG: hypothetical protein K9K86_05730 [Pseudomonadales bacterium]|nr:hypothetical protein [Pseudomonadales bacterium]
MCKRPIASITLYLIYSLFIVGCASSGVAKYGGAQPEDVASEVRISVGEAPDLLQFTGPLISERAGFGEFTKGMLKGGANFGSQISFEGTQSADLTNVHQIIVQLQYTNLGGVYRRYDRAGIEGLDEQLTVSTLSMDRHYQINSVNMTEAVAITVQEAVLRKLALTSSVVLKLGNASGNIEQLVIPGSYIKGYLLAVDRATQVAQPL